MMEKAASLPADAFFLDLEDACAPSEKEGARSLAVAALTSHDYGTRLRSVRINDLGTIWGASDIAAIVSGAGDRIDTIIVPKIEDAAQVASVERLLTEQERRLGLERRIGLELLIESARAAVNIREIAQASDRVEALVFGPGDYATSMGIPQREIGASDERYPGHQWHWIMSQIAVHARAVGAQPIDGPCADINDEAGFRESALRARLLGFEGKWCIHPNQLLWANDAFAPTAGELEHAERILAAYEEAVAAGRGAIAVDGKLVDEASRKVAEGVVARSRAAGVAQ